MGRGKRTKVIKIIQIQLFLWKIHERLFFFGCGEGRGGLDYVIFTG